MGEGSESAMKMRTTIKVQTETRDELERLRIVKRETYDEVIRRLIEKASQNAR
jgi:predicted CopG family antitoxin